MIVRMPAVRMYMCTIFSVSERVFMLQYVFAHFVCICVSFAVHVNERPRVLVRAIVMTILPRCGYYSFLQ
jgi:hypothetical protein